MFVGPGSGVGGVGMGEGSLRFFYDEVGRAVIIASQGLETVAGAGIAIAKQGFQGGVPAGALQDVQGQGTVIRMDITFPVKGRGAGG